MRPERPVCAECGGALVGAGPAAMCVSCLLGTGASLVMGGGDSAPRQEFPIRFGEYDLLAELGRGGAGRVFSAAHRQLGRRVALKVPAGGELVSRDSVERFRTEARAAASLNHPNIVPVYEVGEFEGQLFLAMRLIDGGSLAARLSADSAKYSSGEAAGLIATLARAAHHAHQRGVLHRDIKPGNILIESQGGAYLTDFGLARLTESDSTLTKTNVILGTPSYMSPEQARGSGQVTTATDVYGLGAVLYELLTGQPPFAGGTTFETVRRLLETELRRPSSLVPGVNRDMETICLKCLEKNPARRYGSAGELADDLERHLRHEPITARPVAAWERAAKWVRRHRGTSAAVFGLLLSVVTGVVMLVLANAQLETARLRLDEEVEKKRSDLALLNVRTGNRLAEEGDGFAALASFAEAASLDEKNAGRLAEHQFRFAATLGLLPALEHTLPHPAAVNAAAFSGGGRWIATACSDNTARLWNAATGLPLIAPLPHGSPVWWVGFAAGGKRLVTRTFTGDVYLWDTAGGAPVAGPFRVRAAMRDKDGVPPAIGISPDGLTMALPGAHGVELRAVMDGASRLPALECGDQPNCAIFSPDGRQLTVPCEHGTLLSFDSATGSPLAKSHGQEGWRGGGWSPDGNRLALTDRNFHARVSDAYLAETSPPLGHMGMVLGCAWSADSQWLLTWSHDNTVLLRDPESGRTVIPPLRHRGPVLKAAFSPDGGSVASASADTTARLWDAATGLPRGSVLRHGAAVRDLTWSADGARMITASADGAARVWRTAAGGASREWRARHPVQHVALSPDEEFAAVQTLDSEVLIIRMAGGSDEVRALRDPAVPAAPVCVGWKEGGRLLILSLDGRLSEWEASSGRLVRTWKCGPPAVDGQPVVEVMAGLSFSPDGRHFAGVPLDGPPVLFATATGKPLRGLGAAPGADFLSWSPCGDFVVVNQAGQAVIYNVNTGVPECRPPMPPGTILPIPDFGARRLACILDDSSIVIIDSLTGGKLTNPLRHESMVRHAAFTRDGKVLASVGHDLSLRLWSAVTGEPLAPPMRHPGLVLEVAADASGRGFLTAGNDGIARYWRVPFLPLGAEEMRRMAAKLGGK